MEQIYNLASDEITNVLGAVLLTEVGVVGYTMYEAGQNYTINPFKAVKDNCKTCKSGGWLGAGICGAISLGVSSIESLSSLASLAFGADLGKDEAMAGAGVLALVNPLPPFVGAGLSVTATIFWSKDRFMTMVLPAVLSTSMYVYQWKQLQNCK